MKEKLRSYSTDAIIKTLENRKGFDAWWHDISKDDQEEIKDEIEKIVDASH